MKTTVKIDLLTEDRRIDIHDGCTIEVDENKTICFRVFYPHSQTGKTFYVDFDDLKKTLIKLED